MEARPSLLSSRTKARDLHFSFPRHTAVGSSAEAERQPAAESHHARNRWLIAIGVLKLLKAVLFVSMGFGIIRLLHRDIADVLLRAALALRFDPENRIINVLLEKSALLSPHLLKEISFGIFAYAILDTIEGIGLVLEKAWAEYFTLVLTGSFLPWEIYEIIRHVTVLKIVVALLNLAVFLYLAWVVYQKMRNRPKART
jgi:uncharacterized membrane protein (DUF2068 family)